MSRRGAAAKQRRAETDETQSTPDHSRRRPASPDAPASPQLPASDWTRYRPPRDPVPLGIVLALLAGWIAFLAWMAL